ncbi:DNA-directed RNA polymerase III subunit rpc25 [Phlyctochytrium bullatum]|nr:DNA-directed RNA polymerase III subunit rpc25 [Phlyctochytrium bullatum]
MFELVTLNDHVRVHPRDFGKTRPVAVTDELNVKYANKVKHDVGLCICVFDILSLGDGIVHSVRDGAYMIAVEFRLVVFRPFIGEILIGKVSSMSPDGLKVSLDFFDDIIVPPQLMIEGCEYSTDSGLWVWRYVDEDDGSERLLEIEKNDRVRVRVEGETFVEAETAGPKNPVGAPQGVDEVTVPPFSLTCSMMEQGFGVIAWWE